MPDVASRPCPLPRSHRFDDTRALLADGYRFIGTRCRQLGSDGFETRLTLRKAVCVSGHDAARMFYQPDRFTRVGAMPPTALRLLQDKGSVQLLDGEAHRIRKRMFMSLMTPASLQRLVDLFEAGWLEALPAWERDQPVVLQHAVEAILIAAVCAWAGLSPSASELDARMRELTSMIDGAGSIGWRNWKGLALRWRSERWVRAQIRRVRKTDATERDDPLARIAMHRDADGSPLSLAAAGVELLNLLRPTVAVARYITFAAHALQAAPACDARLRAGDDALLEPFVQEVRRLYPFFPLVAGRVLLPFEWRDRDFDVGEWVLLDIYGTNRDARRWPDPDTFSPERFSRRNIDPFELIPQGGGSHDEGHRCAGEWLTIALMKAGVRMLTRHMSYRLPPQDLSIDMARMPAIPASRMVLGTIVAGCGGIDSARQGARADANVFRAPDAR